MKKNLKTIIGISACLIIAVSTTVTAATIYNSKDIKYNSDKTDKTNVKDSLDELYSKLGKCPDGYGCFKLTGISKSRIRRLYQNDTNKYKLYITK